MSNIYKFHHINSSGIKKTYTFNDIKPGSKSSKQTPILYEDDMIINIKHKLANLFDDQSPSEMYLFCKSKQVLNQSTYYSILTQNDNFKLTLPAFKRFVSNIATNNTNSQFLKKPNDISTKLLNNFYKNTTLWDDKEKSMITPIGISAFYKRRYIFNHNPYFLKQADENIEEDMQRFVITENKQLLFKYKPENNEIYFCFADELLDFFKSQSSSIPEKYILELYFPNLASQDIYSLENIRSKKTQLKSNSEKEYKKIFDPYNKNIDLLHTYSTQNIENLKYKINYIYFTIQPAEPLQLPLDIMFKKTNSTNIIPLIKYNPGKNLESIYRLYTDDHISDKGMKIPTLYVNNKESGRKIKTISENILYNKRIGFYLDLANATDIDINEEVYCIILDNGDIQIKLQPKSIYNIENIEAVLFPIIQKYIIDIVNVFIHKKNIYYLKTLTSSNIELNKFNISFYTDDISEFSFKNLKCSSSVFSVLSKNEKDNKYDLKYKRVSFYKKMDDIQSFINLKFEEGIPPDEIIQLVTTNFSLSQEDAGEIINNFINEAGLQRDAFENKKIKLETNPGFDITIETKIIDNVNIDIKQLFTVEHINDFNYVSKDIIKKFINSLININNLDTPIKECVKTIKEKAIEEEIVEQKAVIDTRLTHDESDEEDDDVSDLLTGFFGNMEDADTSSDDEENDDKTDDAKADDAKADDDSGEDIDDLPDSLSESLSGGAGKPNVDLTSISLKGRNNWFTNRLKTRDKDVFVLSREQLKNKNYLSYSRSCPWQHKRQPIIVNDSELKKITTADEKSKSKSYDGVIKYRGYNYICPRYWCFKDDNGESRSLSFQQINNGECGGWDAVNPKDAKTLQKGKRIVELTDEKLHNNSKSNNPLIYKPFFPVVQNPDKHPKNLCAPCCFKEPIEYDGFPEDSTETREKRKSEQNDFFKHLYQPGKKVGEITIDDSVKDDEDVKQFAKEWKGVGPSFTITKKDNNIVITDIKENDSKKLEKIDMIPSYKKKGKSVDRKEVDDILLKKATNIRYKKCIPPKTDTAATATATTTDDERQDTETDGAKKQRKQRKPNMKGKPIALKSLKFPLDPDEFGYIKPSLKNFIQYNTESLCYNNPPRDSTLRPGASCLLRLGIKRNNNQSFLQNIARIKEKKVSTLKNMLVDKITVSKFVLAFKGELINIFYDESKKINTKKQNHIIESLKKDTQQKIIGKFMEIEELKNKLVNSYLNFIDYIKDETVTIDYSYLWDFICKPDVINEAGVLFETGVNLVIFNSPQNDITDKIEIICPKHTFSDEIFSEFKPTIMLYKEGAFFEPIVLYDNNQNTTQILFDYTDLMKDTMVNTLFADIKNKIVEGCSLKPSMPSKYDFKKNISAKQLIEKIESINDAKVVHQVVHYNFTTIAIIVKIKNKNKSKNLYIPCHPSPIIIDLNYKYVDSKDNLFDAQDTYDLLIDMAKKYDIPCHPLKILVSDQVNVSGFITETNQVVPTSQYDYDPQLFPMKTKSGADIPKKKSVINITENSEYFSDKDILKSSIEDIERVTMVRNFILEKNFYMCFRNMLKKTVNSDKNGNNRQSIIDILDLKKVKSSDTLKEYNTKFNKIKKIIEKLDKKTNKYVIYQNVILNNLYRQIKNGETICFNNINDGSINLPSKNLIDGTDNKEKYIVKIVDELIRFPRLKNYILHNKSVTSLDVIKYSINKNEIIVLEDELDDYLTDVVLKKTNPYVKTNQVGFTKPVKTKKYKSKYSLDYKIEDDKEDEEPDNKPIQATTPQLKADKDTTEPDQTKQPETDKMIQKLNIDKYVSGNEVGEAPRVCALNKSSSKNTNKKVFNNYDINKSFVFHKMSAPTNVDKTKINCTWNVFKEIYSDYTKREISKQEICYTLLHILITLNNENTIVTKPGSVTESPNYFHILDMTHRKSNAAWKQITEDDEDKQWKHLFNIITIPEFYLTEFELFLLCDYFKIPCIIHGTVDNTSPSYGSSKIKYYDPLYTTFNTSNIGKKPDTPSKNNLYTNRNKESFCYIIVFKQFILSDYYDKNVNRNNMGINKYYRKEYNIPFDIGILKTTKGLSQIKLSAEPVKELIKHSVSPNGKQYIDLIFKEKTNGYTIYESFENEFEKFKEDKKAKAKPKSKLKIK